MSSNCTWFCNYCRKPVVDNDHVGYLTDKEKLEYIPRTLGFWHDACAKKNDAFLSSVNVSDFKRMIVQHLHMWLHDKVSPNDVGIMALRSLVPDYDLVYPYYDKANAQGIIEPNLPAPGLHQHEIITIRKWLEENGMI